MIRFTLNLDIDEQSIATIVENECKAEGKETHGLIGEPHYREFVEQVIFQGVADMLQNHNVLGGIGYVKDMVITVSP